ncbi:MAG: FHA domain-containing protein [Candidatus Promineifilaceae bacterium]
MRGKFRNLNNVLVVIVSLLLLLSLALPVLGQDEEPSDEDTAQEEPTLEPLLPQIFITGNDVTSPPTAALHVYGRDLDGKTIDFNNDPVVMTSGGRTIDAAVSGTYPVGTFTVFLVDLPNSVEDQIPAIQEAIEQYASTGGVMQENVDSIAIYQVGESNPKTLLGPTTFHQEVQNFFVDGLTPETGSTALRDSLFIMLDEIEGLKPNPEMVTSVVVMSDGTDVVSTEHSVVEVIKSANEKDIAINSIWVPGTGLTIAQQEEGQAYLDETAEGTRGFAAALDDSASVSELWDTIASFRDHTRIVFQMDSLGGGIFDVTLSLASNPAVSDSTTIEVPENQPQVTLNLPEEAASLTLPSLDEPILLRLGATVSWLDGFEREISEATLKVNGRDVVSVPVDQLDDFSVEVSNLQYGPNELELLIVDEQGLQASNAPAIINVVQGERVEIPETLQPSRNIGSIVLNVFLVLVVLAVVVGLIYALMRSGLVSRLVPGKSSHRSGQNVTYSTIDDSQAMVGGMPSSTATSQSSLNAYLEIIESVTEMPPTVKLDGAMVRIGRSPSMCDIAFRDDLTVSRQHAVFMLEGSHYRLFDENSTSGSWVNGRQVPEYGVELADGDEIHLGAVHMMFRQM